jgi:hypothetical protein
MLSLVANSKSTISISDQTGQEAGIVLNFLPVTFSAQEVAGSSLNYEDENQLRRLQDRYKGVIFFRRDRHRIQAIPLSTQEGLVVGEPWTFTTRYHWSLFDRLLEEGVRRFLRTKYPSMGVPEYGRVFFSVVREQHDLVRAALVQRRDVLTKLNFFHIYRRYRIAGSHLRRTPQDDPSYGILVHISTDWQISASIADLISRGVDVVGCYVAPIGAAVNSIGSKTAGCISRVVGLDVYLVDFRDQEVVSAREYSIEASPENIARIAGTLLGQRGSEVTRLVRAEVSKLLCAEGQLQRIETMAGILGENPIPCADGLTANISWQALRVAPRNHSPTLTFEPPKYMLRYGRAPVAGPISTALASQGPLDQDSFKKTTPHVLVITPNQYLGRVEQFLRTWRDGGLAAPYQKGFVQQYVLRGCDFHFVDFQETPQGPAENYHQACLRALQESRDMVRRYDLAFVIVQEQHRLLGVNDPYLITKVALMNDGIPVQEVEIETVDPPPENLPNLPFVLNNIALACYAKIGGTPWSLASPKGQGITHEIIVGLGSATLRDGRLHGQERHVGITTLFNYDGIYLVSNVSRESSYDEYSEALQSVLLSSVRYVGIQKGWQPGDRVRLLFHTFKPLKNLEIEAVKRLVQDSLPDYTVDFAFLEIGQEHEWVAYDPKSPGFTSRSGRVRGRQVPQRGTTIILDDQRALLSVIGPAELKTAEQGCPAPIQIRLNGASSFRDLEYLARQVFEFTHMSWKTFNLPAMPITITYSDAIANLLGRLRRVQNWNSDVLQTTQLRGSLWFL